MACGKIDRRMLCFQQCPRATASTLPEEEEGVGGKERNSPEKSHDEDNKGGVKKLKRMGEIIRQGRLCWGKT